jgi:predicted ribonuclease YlaK
MMAMLMVMYSVMRMETYLAILKGNLREKMMDWLMVISKEKMKVIQKVTMRDLQMVMQKEKMKVI